MNDRKQHVIYMAHQLFIDKGLQATSIQDILEYSGISKGTFYNYFSSKNELLIALFKTLYKKMEQDQNDLLIGQDPANITIFIQQVEILLKTNRTNKLLSLFEEVLASNDEELKQHIKQGQLRLLQWIYERFLDIFGEEKKPYLLDGAIMFMGMINHNMKYYAMVHVTHTNIHEVVRYSVARIIKLVEEVSRSGDQLFPPELLESWLENFKKVDYEFQQTLHHTVLALKKAFSQQDNQPKYVELLDFIQDELLQSKQPRKFLVESAMSSLQEGKGYCGEKKLHRLEQLIESYFARTEEAHS